MMVMAIPGSYADKLLERLAGISDRNRNAVAGFRRAERASPEELLQYVRVAETAAFAAADLVQDSIRSDVWAELLIRHMQHLEAEMDAARAASEPEIARAYEAQLLATVGRILLCRIWADPDPNAEPRQQLIRQEQLAHVLNGWATLLMAMCSKPSPGRRGLRRDTQVTEPKHKTEGAVTPFPPGDMYEI